MGELIFMRSNRSGNIYILKILKEKHKEEYRICNLTRGHICPCIFTSFKGAIDDIAKYVEDGRITIIHND